LLVVAGVLVALAIQRLPGIGGHSPADGFHAAGVTAPIELPGILFAALGTLSFGVVLGPEAPLILMGSGLGALAVRLAARDAPPTATTVIAAAGSFAAIAALFGSPLLSAFLMLEAAGIGGPMLGSSCSPACWPPAIGELVFVGLDSLTGFGTFSLAIPNLPPFGHPPARCSCGPSSSASSPRSWDVASSGSRGRSGATWSPGWSCSCPSSER
jgi:H+/Cl- antiporter ClcA